MGRTLVSVGRHWAVRVDSSLSKGAGHLMRCLVLAKQASLHGVSVEFLCADLPGHLCDMVIQQGFGLRMISTKNFDSSPTHFDWECDASQMLSHAGSSQWDLLVVDHYSIDYRWEGAMRPAARHILVIDDLADRIHDCDFLLDQNYYPNLLQRYDKLVPTNCQKFLGPSFLLLRQEFINTKFRLKRQTKDVKRILISFGGTDETNVTSKALDAITLLGRPDIAIDVVIGANAPHREAVEVRISTLPQSILHVQTSRMAELIASADLAIGACGSSTWERCYLGLPTLVLVLADNQRQGAASLDTLGVVLNLGEARNMTPSELAAVTAGLIADSAARESMTERSLSLGIGAGPSMIDLLLNMGT